MLSRRTFVEASIAFGASALFAARPQGLKIGTMDTILGLAGKPESVRVAKQLGLEGLQVTLGKSIDGRTLPLEDPELQAAFRSASKEHAVALDGTFIDMLTEDCLKDNPNAPMWVRKGIQITKNINAPILMLVSFGKCQASPRPALDSVISLLRELTPEAERAGVVLGFENNLSGEDNRYAFDKINSRAFKIWYDVGNSTSNGYDAPKEIRALGRDRICAFHFKDKNGYLGQGQVNMPEILTAIEEIGFVGYANLETASPSGNIEADTKRNLDYVKKLIAP